LPKLQSPPSRSTRSPRSPVSRTLLLCARRLENLKGTHERVVHRHHRPGIVEFPAVVGRGEDGHQLPPSEEFVPVLHDLMRAHHQVEVVAPEELAHDVPAEGEGDAAIVFVPALGGVLCGGEGVTGYMYWVSVKKTDISV